MSVNQLGIAFLACVILYPGNAWADPPLNVLQEVQVVTDSGVVRGFVTYWNIDFAEVRGTPPEPDTVEEALAPRSPVAPEKPPTNEELKKLVLKPEKLIIYPSLRMVPHPRSMLVQIGPSVGVERTAIRTLSFPANKLNGYTWYGMVNEVSPATAKLLESPPVHSCTETCPGEVCQIYHWASYDPKIGAKELVRVCSDGWSYNRERQADVASLRKNPRVFRFEESND